MSKICFGNVYFSSLEFSSPASSIAVITASLHSCSVNSHLEWICTLNATSLSCSS
ncbi:MAG: DUF2673 domain-containing protein [Lachnospiraceae bacterium]|nr:DUF2673 domain-containing protein [Lachnospiraceae bacterium]